MLDLTKYETLMKELMDLRVDTPEEGITITNIASQFNEVKAKLERASSIVVESYKIRNEIKSKHKMGTVLLDQKMNALLASDNEVRQEKTIESRRAVCATKLNQDILRNATLEEELFLAETLLNSAKQVFHNLKLTLNTLIEIRNVEYISLFLEGKLGKLPKINFNISESSSDTEETF